eukprot:SAG11_NODE_2128_length_3781_cov_1.507061_5_plen_164_part_00
MVVRCRGVCPDIVTMGKPFGNGMPLAAVVTTQPIADSFNNGLEYFNTFGVCAPARRCPAAAGRSSAPLRGTGGNPVCAAAGLAVLDCIEEEALQAHAAAVGDKIRADVISLATRYPLIGQVRGSGLFIGSDRSTLWPAPLPPPQQRQQMPYVHPHPSCTPESI